LREETLENQILEKDSKLLEMEYKVQKKDRVSSRQNQEFYVIRHLCVTFYLL